MEKSLQTIVSCLIWLSYCTRAADSMKNLISLRINWREFNIHNFCVYTIGGSRRNKKSIKVRHYCNHREYQRINHTMKFHRSELKGNKLRIATETALVTTETTRSRSNLNLCALYFFLPLNSQPETFCWFEKKNLLQFGMQWLNLEYTNCNIEHRNCNTWNLLGWAKITLTVLFATAITHKLMETVPTWYEYIFSNKSHVDANGDRKIKREKKQKELGEARPYNFTWIRL